MEDGVLFDIDSVVTMRIKEDADYEGVRVKVDGYIGKARESLQIDIGFGDIIVPKPVILYYPSLLNSNCTEIKAYSLESVIAEMFEAMISLSTLNSRMKDFYDIYTIMNIKDFDGRVL